MLRDWKPTRRSVLAGLLGLASLGTGLTWLIMQCYSSREPERGTLLLTYQGHSDWVYAVAWSPDGKRIACGPDNTTVQVWDATDGGNVFTYRGHSNSVAAIAWSPDGKRIASASYDKTVQVWVAP